MDDGWETRRINVQFHLNTVINQSPSQGPLPLSPHGEKERERDPGVVWSQVRWTIDIIREGSFDFRILLVTFLSTSKRSYLEKSNKHFNHHNVHYLFSSLHFASFSGSYSNVNLKAKKVQCLESSYGGQDV